MAGRFQCFETLSAGWYPLLPSARLRVKKPLGLTVLGRRLVLLRGSRGELLVADARCPHLGTDLSHGEFCGDELVCAMHRWSFELEQGTCSGAPGHPSDGEWRTRGLRFWPALERLGWCWAFAGKQVLFPFPEPESPVDLGGWVVRGPIKRCHPHAVTLNGLDAIHFETLHAFEHVRPPRFEVLDEFRLRLTLCAIPRSPALRRLLGTRSAQPLEADFTTFGSNLSRARVHAPFRVHFLMAGRPSMAEKGTETVSVVHFDRSRPCSAVRALILLRHLFQDDVRVLEHLRMHQGFTDLDDGARCFVALTERLPGLDMPIPPGQTF